MKLYKVIVMLCAFTLLSFAVSAQTTRSKNLIKNAAPVTGALNYVNSLEPISYQYDQQQIKGLNLPAGVQYTISPQSAAATLPGIVTTESKLYPAGKGSMRSVDVNKVDMQALVPVLLGAIKEQQQQINDLKAELQLLKQSRNTAAR